MPKPLEIEILEQAIKGMSAYLYNTAMYDVLLALFEDPHPDYIKEKLTTIRERGFYTFLGYLDHKHLRKFCENVLRYMNDHNNEII